MRRLLRSMCLAAWLALGHGTGAGAQDLAPPGPVSPADSPLPREDPAAATPAPSSPPHEALRPSGTRRDPERIGKAPPSLIAERPGAERPGPDDRWIEGYWDWDRNRQDFAWVTGLWLVPPRGEFWVNGYWRRDAGGWYRVPGFWSGGGQVPKVVRVQEAALIRPMAGPSLTRPDEPMGAAPAPDHFYIPGEYIPAGGGVAWQPGYWAPSQPGWEWIPARWERRGNAWVFHEGFWDRARGTPIRFPGGPQPAGGTALASAPAGMGSPATRPGSNPVVAANAAATPGETRPGQPRPGPPPRYPQPPPSARARPQPAPPPGRGARGNGRSALGGFLRRVLP